MGELIGLGKQNVNYKTQFCFLGYPEESYNFIKYGNVVFYAYNIFFSFFFCVFAIPLSDKKKCFGFLKVFCACDPTTKSFKIVCVKDDYCPKKKDLISSK